MAGYMKDFLGDGIELPLPEFSPSLAGDVLHKPTLKNEVEAEYVNYTVIMNRERRSPIVVALNIDQNQLMSVDREDNWRIDTRIGAEFQLDNDYYRNNPWDRGHMARRANAAWGRTRREALRASNETFYYSNASLQHANFNQDEWLALEDWVKDLHLDKNGKITSFSGPVYGDFDRTVHPQGRELAVIPWAFFKVICFVNKHTDALDVRAFLMVQDRDALADKSGRRMFNFQNYQVTVSEIENQTGLQFDDQIYEGNPLLFHDNEEARGPLNISHFPERIEVDGPEEIVSAEQPRDFFADDDVPVFIAAAMVNPIGNERGNEWVSIINLSRDDIDLDGWTLSDLKRNPLNLGTVLDEEQRILRPGEAVSVRPITPLMLENTGGIIALHDKPEDGQKRGRRIDRVSYTKEDASREGVPVVFAYRTE